MSRARPRRRVARAAAVIAVLSGDELYLVIGDGTILHSDDGARTWDAAFRP